MVFGFEVAGLFCGDEGLLEGLEGVVGDAAEGGFVDHWGSLADEGGGVGL